RLASGTRTLSKNRALVTEARRLILCLITCALKPAKSFSTTKPGMPSSVCAQTMAISARLPLVTLRRERRRNGEADGSYAARDAQRRSRKRRHDASSLPRIREATWAVVESRLREDWSPEQIAGHGDVAISHERIYQRVAEDRRRGGTLWKHLRCRKRRRRRNGTSRERQRFGGRRIQQRPAIVAERRRVGDWEGDTIVGTGLARVVTMVERTTGFTRLRRVPSGEAEPTLRAIVLALHPLIDHV